MDAYCWFVVAVAVYIGLELHGISRKKSEIEEQLVALSRHVGLLAEVGSEPSAHVKELAVDRTKYVEAVRAYRTETGASLKQARRAVDPLTPNA